MAGWDGRYGLAHAMCANAILAIRLGQISLVFCDFLFHYLWEATRSGRIREIHNIKLRFDLYYLLVSCCFFCAGGRKSSGLSSWRETAMSMNSALSSLLSARIGHSFTTVNRRSHHMVINTPVYSSISKCASYLDLRVRIHLVALL